MQYLTTRRESEEKRDGGDGLARPSVPKGRRYFKGAERRGAAVFYLQVGIPSLVPLPPPQNYHIPSSVFSEQTERDTFKFDFYIRSGSHSISPLYIILQFLSSSPNSTNYPSTYIPFQ